MQISFQDSVTHDARGNIVFLARVNGRTAVCSISLETLQDYAPEEASKTATELFESHRWVCESAATKKLLEDPDSIEVMITLEDL